MLNTARVGLFFLGLAAYAGVALAMTPGPTIIRECPGCKQPLVEYTIGSGNTIGSEFWSDGKLEAPMLPLGPDLVKCPHCQKVFWIADAKELAEVSWVDDPAKQAKWAKAKELLRPMESEYLTAAQAAGVSREHELLARKLAWWLANDANRRRANRSFAWSGARLENLQKLSALLDGKIACQVILKAEIARELGRFEECSNLLARPFEGEDSGFADYAAFVRRLAADGKIMVELLPTVQPRPAARSQGNPGTSEADGTYTVQAGDTLTKIARQLGVTVKSLTDANPGLNPIKLRIGQKMKLPGK